MRIFSPDWGFCGAGTLILFPPGEKKYEIDDEYLDYIKIPPPPKRIRHPLSWL
jgi:hypothetical protein